ncbi:hypothetical protein HDU76_005515, partial [Blyttiomyces sp. JEL0837]
MSITLPTYTSRWDSLPHEIKEQILELCDPLTRYLNLDKTNNNANKLQKDEKSQLKFHAQVWRMAAQNNWQGDLSILPDLGEKIQLLVDIGFDEVVTSKDFYDRLCELKPDRIGIDGIKRFLEGKKSKTPSLWQVIYKHQPLTGYHSAKKKGILFGSTRTSFVHIAMNQFWPDRLIAFEDIDKVKRFVHAGISGYCKLFVSLFHDVVQLLSVPDAHDSEGKRYHSLSTICNIILPGASHKGSTNIVKFILEMKNFEPIDRYISYSIGHAANNNHIDIFNMLLAIHDANPVWDKNEHLATACYNGCTQIVKTLLEMDDVNPSNRNNTPLQNASQEGHLDTVKMLLERDEVDPGDDHNEAIRAASLYGHLDVVRALLATEMVDATANENECIINACQSGNIDLVKLLLEIPGVDVTTCNNQPLKRACGYGHLNIVKLLLTFEGVDPTAGGNKAFRAAAKKGQVEIVKFLLKLEGVDATAKDNEAIRNACEYGHANVVKVLLDVEGVDPRVQNSVCLRNAAKRGHDEVVKALLACKKYDI